MALSRVFHRTAKVSHFGYQTTHGMKLARLLTALTCTSAIVFAHEPQEPAQWGADVVRACTSQRFGLRLAASKKVAQAGDAAVPAVREFAATHGKDALPAAMVEAIVDLGGNGEAVLALLTDWASDRDFYWRAQAMKGLAVRSKEPLLGARFRQLFAAHEQDAAWLMRVYAQLGFALAEKSATAAEATPGDVVRAKELDPRASTKLAALRSQHGLPFAPAHLMDALGDERTFLGDPWGRRRAQEACTALQNWLGADGGYRSDASFAENRAAIDQLLKLARSKTNLALLAPAQIKDPEVTFTGGIELLSCRNGDLFIRWTKDGTIFAGLDAATSTALSQSAWQTLSQTAASLRVEPQSGVVICDKLRLQLCKEALHGVTAPAALAPTLADWLKQVAARIEEAENPALASALIDRLQQFVLR